MLKLLVNATVISSNYQQKRRAKTGVCEEANKEENNVDDKVGATDYHVCERQDDDMVWKFMVFLLIGVLLGCG